MSDQSKALTFEGVFDVVDIRPKRHTSGNRMEILLSVNYSEEIHREAIPMLFKQVKVFMAEYEAQQEMAFDDEGEETEDMFEDDLPGEDEERRQAFGEDEGGPAGEDSPG